MNTGEVPTVYNSGSFFEELLAANRKQQLPGTWLRIIREDTPDENWQMFASAPLSTEPIETILASVRSVMAEALYHTGDDGYYQELKAAGTGLIAEILAKAKERGVELEANTTQVPVTFTDAMVAIGYVTVIDGLVQVNETGPEVL